MERAWLRLCPFFSWGRMSVHPGGRTVSEWTDSISNEHILPGMEFTVILAGIAVK